MKLGKLLDCHHHKDTNDKEFTHLEMSIFRKGP